MNLQEFELAVHKKDAQGQHNVLEQCKHSPGFSAESMLKLAAFSKSSCHSSADITKETLHAALKLLLAKGHAVQYDQVAQVSCVYYVMMLHSNASMQSACTASIM